jgi:high affinity Mn2+ porin
MKGFCMVLLVILVGLFLVIAPCARAGEQEELLQELRALKERIEQLETKIKEIEGKSAQAHEEQKVEGQEKKSPEGQAEEKKLRKEVAAVVEALKGIEFGFSATGVVQGSIGNHKNQGIPSDRERADRVGGSLSADLEISKQIGKHGRATAIISAAYGDGLDPRIPSWWGINGDAEDENRVYLKELWYEHKLFDEKLILTLGKLDLTAYFDTNAVANCENTQFLSPGFVNAAAVEFPDDNGPGVRITFAPTELFDISFGWGQGEEDWDELGHRSLFIGEAGLHPRFGELQGNYRLYGWFRQHHLDEDVVSWDDRGRGVFDSRNGWGLGLSLDQAVTPQITLFARAGYQDEKVYAFAWAWSLGAEVKGYYWGRKTDALGIAYGMGMISDDYKAFQRLSGEPWFRKNESHLELYYRFQLNDHIAISPDLQVLWNAQGDARFAPVTVIGVRGTLEF